MSPVDGDVTREELAGRLDDPALVVLDVRTAEEFSGELGAPCDPRQGHIPGAQHLDVAELMGLGAAEIRECVGEPEEVEVIAYCHSGGRSAIACSVLRAAGYRARNYAGSWHEWSRDESLPVEPS
jgi:thiosulfate/3-mercaptopyruvate sulfurtransferase